MNKSPFEILGVPQNASEEELKKAYKQKCFEFHPDRFATESQEKQKEAEQNFKEVQQAYNSIKDGTANQGEGLDGFVEFMKQTFQGFRQKRKPSNEEQILSVQVDDPVILSFKESILGCSKFVEFNFTHQCLICSGVGAIPSSKHCKTCNGSGVNVSQQNSKFGFFRSETPCGSCHGAGKELETCKFCNGKKEHTIEFKENLVFEPNSPANKQIEKQTMGAKIRFLFRVQTQLPDEFTVELNENNERLLVKEIQVPVVDFMLGNKVVINLEDGLDPITVDIVTPQTEIFVPNKGVPSRGERGRLKIKIFPTFPKNLTEKQKELLNKFKEE
jgi:molecular chaperone DnaJ